MMMMMMAIAMLCGVISYVVCCCCFAALGKKCAEHVLTPDRPLGPSVCVPHMRFYPLRIGPPFPKNVTTQQTRTP